MLVIVPRGEYEKLYIEQINAERSSLAVNKWEMMKEGMCESYKEIRRA